MKEVISQEVIENFLNGGDDENYIVGVEYDYPTNTIYKIIQDPEQGKIVKTDSFTPFIWVGDLSGLNFYNNSKTVQKKRMGEFGIIIEKLDTHGNERLENGMTHIALGGLFFAPSLLFLPYIHPCKLRPANSPKHQV